MPGVLRRRPGCFQVDVVAHVDLGVLRVGHRVLGVDGLHDGQSGVEHPLLVRPREGDAQVLQPDEGVEVAAVGDVVAHRPVAVDVDDLIEGVAVGGDVLQGHRLGVAVAYAHPGRDQSGGGVEAYRRLRFDGLDHPRLDEDRGDADRAVPAHRQAAGHLDVEDAEVGVRPGRWLQDRAGHRGVSAGFAHEQGAQTVAFLDEAAAPFGHRRPGEGPDAAGDHAGRHALGVGVHGVVADGGAHGQLTPASTSARTVARRASSVRGSSGRRGGRQTPPRRPVMSWPSLIAWTNSVLLSQRRTGWSRR